MSHSNWVDNSGYTQIELYPNGEYKSFVPVIETEWKIAEQFVKIRANRVVHFYENGQIKSCTTCDDVSINVYGVPVLILHNTLFELYENGGVKKITIGPQPNGFFRSKNWTYRGRNYRPKTVVEFSVDGKVL